MNNIKYYIIKNLFFKFFVFATSLHRTHVQHLSTTHLYRGWEIFIKKYLFIFLLYFLSLLNLHVYKHDHHTASQHTSGHNVIGTFLPLILYSIGTDSKYKQTHMCSRCNNRTPSSRQSFYWLFWKQTYIAMTLHNAGLCRCDVCRFSIEYRGQGWMTFNPTDSITRLKCDWRWK